MVSGNILYLFPHSSCLTMKTQPTLSSERIVSLDVLRGFAVLGILIMNIQSFSMISAAYFFPTAYGDFTGIHKVVWIFSHIFADTKFITLFSILFGAGIVLFTERLKKKGIKSVALHYRRIFWLLVFGLMHAYLLWHGDILVTYALCGFLVVLFRKKTPRTLFILGLVFIAIPSLFYLFSGTTMQFWPEEQANAFIRSWQPLMEDIHHELEVFRGGWLKQMELRVEESVYMQTVALFYNTGWRCFGLMLIGMALFKTRVLSAERTNRFYTILALAGLIAGLVLVITGVYKNFEHDFAVEYSFFLGSQYNYWGSLGISMAYIALIMLLTKASANGWFLKSLRAVGQMAFTNYLLQTILCTFIFYGHGLGLFGKIERFGQIGIVAGIWIIQMVVSPLWLKYFRYGPLEWAWRSLTYWHLQPFKRKAAGS